ncbi:unnamed protein product, partial [Ectocarpus sp. 12 AP-2014]
MVLVLARVLAGCLEPVSQRETTTYSPTCMSFGYRRLPWISTCLYMSGTVPKLSYRVACLFSLAFCEMRLLHAAWSLLTIDGQASFADCLLSLSPSHHHHHRLLPVVDVDCDWR